MKAVILAAGKGTRLYPLTKTTPKILTSIFNKPLLDHFVNILDGIVDEIILVIGNKEKYPLQESIIDYVDSKNWPLEISFVIQEEARGTAHAFLQTKDKFNEEDKVFLFYGDDIYSRADVEAVNEHEHGIVGLKVNDPEKWGILSRDKDGNLVKMVEKPKEFVGDLASIGIRKFDTDIFKFIEEQDMTDDSREYDMSFGTTKYAEEKDFKVVESIGWNPAGYPWHILDAHDNLIINHEHSVNGEIHSDVEISEKITLGNGSVIKEGCKIDDHAIIGENCEIGPNVQITGNCVIGSGTKIASGTIIDNSTIMENVDVGKNCEIGHAVIGNNVKIGENVTLEAESEDDETVFMDIKDKLVDTKRKNFSAVVGDNVVISDGEVIRAGSKVEV